MPSIDPAPLVSWRRTAAVFAIAIAGLAVLGVCARLAGGQRDRFLGPRSATSDEPLSASAESLPGLVGATRSGPASQLTLACSVVEDSGRGVSGATLTLSWEFGGRRKWRTGRTDADGEYVFCLSDPPPRTMRLSVRHAHFKDLTVRVAEGDRACRATLYPGGRVFGRVQFPDGQPAPGVQVLVGGSGFESPIKSTFTDGDGRYLVGGLEESPVQVFSTAIPGRFVAAELGVPTATLIVEHSLILVRVLDRHGGTLSRAHCRGEFAGSEVCGETDDSGECLLVVPPGRDGTIVVADCEHEYCPVLHHVNSNSSSPRRHVVQVQLTELATSECAITVLESDGERAGGPMSDAVVRFFGVGGGLVRQARFPLQGDYCMCGLPAGEFRVVVSVDGEGVSDARTVLLQSGARTQVEFELPQCESIAVRWMPSTESCRLGIRLRDGELSATRFIRTDECAVWESAEPAVAGEYELVEIDGDVVLRSTLLMFDPSRRQVASFGS